MSQAAAATITTTSTKKKMVQGDNEKSRPATTTTTAGAPPPIKRTSLNGRWVVDKSRSQLMSDYLRVMDVPSDAIQAHEKGEQETDTYHTITLSDDNTAVRIVKRSRVNDDVVVELEIGKEKTEMLRAWSTDRSIKNPEKRPKKAIATTDDPGKHLKIENNLLTVNGMAHVIDTRKLVQEEVAVPDSAPGGEGDGGPSADAKPKSESVNGNGTKSSDTRSVIVQELVITNEVTGATHTTTRYFVPYDGKLEGEDESPAYNTSLNTGKNNDGDSAEKMT
mmetsp:Transcript_21140/g.50241  ORF Transcript_21140/g.50241 Transcript_21140/m.50241 type:complete len:278 (+) Transcript_21140:36-869(+)